MILVTERYALPALEMVSVCAEDCPTVTSPKDSSVADSDISGAAGTVPLPDTDTVTDASSGSLLVMVMVPVLAPAEAGVKVTVTS